MKKTKIAIDLGHNCPPRDIGANGVYKDECELIREVGNLVVSLLRDLGYEIILVAPSRAPTVNASLMHRINRANVENADYYVSIHFNAFNGKVGGSEVFAVSSKGRTLAQAVLDEILKLGYSNRGVRDGKHLAVVAGTKMPAILIECCFCDNKADMDRYNESKMAIAIVNGLEAGIKKLKPKTS